MGVEMSGGYTKRKLVVESQDEVFYPVVTFLPAKTEVIDFEKLETVELKEEATANDGAESTVLIDVVEKMNKSERKHKWYGLKRWKSRVGTVVVALVAVVAIALVGMRLAGFRTFTVMSGSMEPEYPVGAMLYVQPVNYYDLKVGDVISYVASDDKTVVTHRIVDIEVDKNDASVWRFKTKGDANTAPDANLVHYKNVLGTPMVTIPFIGYVAHNIQQPPGIYITLVVGTLLLAWTFLPGTLEERRKTARKSVA
ncbi:signal peptidase I [Candidatus Saccharibacteria bacterium]|nr:signal peptidase I [Candidatus Saccharibacteria bacterium]